MELKEIIEKLKGQPQDNKIQFDFGGFAPTEFSSWRGSYDQLAIEYDKCHWDKEAMTVKDFIKKCEEIDGKVFTGYKGGDFKMNLNQIVWVSNYGEATDTIIYDVIEKSYYTLLVTKQEDY